MVLLTLLEGRAATPMNNKINYRKGTARSTWSVETMQNVAQMFVAAFDTTVE